MLKIPFGREVKHIQQQGRIYPNLPDVFGKLWKFQLFVDGIVRDCKDSHSQAFIFNFMNFLIIFRVTDWC